MPVIPFPNWAPDSAGVDSGLSDAVLNVFPKARGYGPVPSLAAALAALPGDCKGAVEIPVATNTPIYFAGTATKLYRYDPVAKAWVDVTKAGAAYAVPDDDYWSFERFGTKVVALHINYAPQVYDYASATAFSDLAGNPPRARFSAIVGDVLVLGGLVDRPNAVAWSGLNDITNWLFGTLPGAGSDFNEFPDGGEVMGLAGGESGIVLQRRGIRRMIATGDARNLFQFTRAEEDRGAIQPWSVIKVGARVFFLDSDGFYQFQDGGSAPIGAQVVNDWFARTVDAGALFRTLGVVDRTGPRVFWAFRSGGSALDRTVLDQAVCYDWMLQRWSLIAIPARYWLRGTTLATSIDEITTSIDDLPASLDSAVYAGGKPFTAAVAPDNTIRFMGGASLQATLETGDAMLARPNRAFVRGARLDSDADSFTIAVGGRESLASPVTWKPAAGPAITRLVPARSSARYHRARTVIAAGATWTYATGIEPDAVPEGAR